MGEKLLEHGLIFVFIFHRSTLIDLDDRVNFSVEKKTTNSGVGLSLFPSFYGKLLTWQKVGVEVEIGDSFDRGSWTKKTENKIETKGVCKLSIIRE